MSLSPEKKAAKKDAALLYAYLDISHVLVCLDEYMVSHVCDVDALEATLDNIREVYEGNEPLEHERDLVEVAS